MNANRPGRVRTSKPSPMALMCCIERASSMREAVRRAQALAPADGVVLLAPACSSFDMFKDYADRGRAFRDAVRELIAESA